VTKLMDAIITRFVKAFTFTRRTVDNDVIYSRVSVMSLDEDADVDALPFEITYEDGLSIASNDYVVSILIESNITKRYATRIFVYTNDFYVKDDAYI